MSSNSKRKQKVTLSKKLRGKISKHKVKELIVELDKSRKEWERRL
jgi:hypothetical protein